MKFIYQYGQIKKDVFIKLGEDKGIRFGQMKYGLHIPSKTKTPPEPKFELSREEDDFNDFVWMREEDVKKSTPVKEEYIKKFDLFDKAVKSLGERDIVEYVFRKIV